MKNYKQLIKELPSKKVVFAFGRFNPPTTGHELLVKMVKKVASSQSADHVIYASKTQDSKKNPLPVDKKVHYLNLMFPGTHFAAANAEVRTFIEAAKALNKKYKNIIMIAGSDRVNEYEALLNKYNGSEFNFNTIQVVSAGERDPDADDASGMSATKMRSLASKGDFAGFKKGLPSSIRELDARRLMNDIRQGMGLDVVKEQVKFSVDELREQYFKGEIYLVGQFVESNGNRYEILDRGSNYLVVVDSNGNTARKWIQDVTMSENQIKEDIQGGYAPSSITFKGYTTKHLDNSADAVKAFQDTISRASEKDPVAILNALKATDTYHDLNNRHIAGEALTQDEIQQWKTAHEKAKESLDRIGEFMHHEDYWHMHLHELEGLLTNFKETGKGELQDSAEIEGNMIPEELTDKTLRSTDKVKVARIIATMLGLDKVEGSSNAEALVNSALRRIKAKALNAEGYAILQKMLALATEVGIEYDNNLVPAKLKEEGPTVVAINKKKKNNIAGDIAQPDDVNAINKPGHSLGADDETLRKMKVKHVTEATKKTALDKWRAAADSRLAKQKQDDEEYQKKKANSEYEFKKWQKEVHGDKLKEETLDELSNELLARYKKKAGAESTEADKVGDIKKADKRFSGVMKATKKQFVNDLKKHVKEEKNELGALSSAERAAELKRRKQKIADNTTAAAKKFVDAAIKGVKEEVEQLEELTDAQIAKLHADAAAHATASMNKQSDDRIAKLKNPPKPKSFLQKVGQKQINMVKALLSKEEVDLEEAAIAPVPGQKWKDHAVMVNGTQRAVIHRKNIDNYKKDGWKEVSPGMKEETELCDTCGMSPCVCDHVDTAEKNLEDQLMSELDLTDEQIDHIVDSAQEDDFIDAYDDDELTVVDADTGEEIEDEETVNEEALLEVMSRAERMRARVRFAKTKSKRERRAMIAARTHASTKTVNKRARRLAIKLMKNRLLRGRDVNKLSVGEKERIERVIQKRKNVISRIAMKLTPRVRAIEKARLSHTKFTKGTPNAQF